MRDSTALVLVPCLALNAAAFGIEPSATLAPEPTKAAPPAATAPTAEPDLSPLVHEAILNAPVSEVWKVFSTAEGFKAFGVAQCELDLRVGGLIRSHYNPKGVLGDDGTIQNEIMAFEPERMIAFRIQSPPKDFPFKNAFKSTWSVATLTDLGDGRTHLRLAGMGYTADEESQKMRQFFKAGNEWSMKTLQKRFDQNANAAKKGDVHAASPLAPIEITKIINAPRSEVFRAMTSSDGWKSCLGLTSDIQLVPGGKFEIYFGPTNPVGERGSDGCTVLSYVPDRMFSYTWNAPPKLPFARSKRSWVVVTFDEVSATTTRVRLMHLGFEELVKAHPEHAKEFEETRAYFVNAWPNVLGGFAKHVAPKDKAADAK